MNTDKCRAELARQTIDRHGSGIWFDKWMTRNHYMWRPGKTHAIAAGWDLLTEDSWERIMQELERFRNWARYVLNWENPI